MDLYSYDENAGASAPEVIYTRGTDGGGYESGNGGRRARRPGAGPGAASLIMGLIAFVLFLTLINIPIAIIAIVLAIVGITGYEKRGAAIFGLIFAIASIVMGIGGLALVMSNDNIGSVAEDFYYGEGMQEYYRLMEEYGITINPDTGELGIVPAGGANDMDGTNDDDAIIGNIEEL